MKSRRYSLYFLVLVLLCGVALQAMRVPNVKDGKAGGGQASGKLAARLPAQVAGWSVKDEAIGSNEFVSEAATRILNFDDYAYRFYQRDGRKLGVYIAYWEPGRMPTHKVASHTPDRCWIENGWTCEQARFDVDRRAGGTDLKPAQWRLMAPPPGTGISQYVLYWHLVGDELYDYGDRLNTRPHPMKWLRDSLHYAVKGSQEQYFVRLASDQDLDVFLADPTLAPLWAALAELGLARVPAGTAPAGH